VNGRRQGEFRRLYRWFRAPGAYGTLFHDINGKQVVAKTNGYYPSTKDADMATGIGRPIASAPAMKTP
jgi:hypothetical protein